VLPYLFGISKEVQKKQNLKAENTQLISISR
jgi:hypothetical protein